MFSCEHSRRVFILVARVFIYDRRVTFLCMCVDLSRFLASPTWDAEQQLFVKLFQRARVLITPGKDLHFSQPGWFRICFAM